MSAQKQFEQLLKSSHFFNDVIDTHRRGTANVISAVVQAIIEMEPSAKEPILRKLKEAEWLTGGHSVDTEARRITKFIIDDIQTPRFHPKPTQQAKQLPAAEQPAKPHRDANGQGSDDVQKD